MVAQEPEEPKYVPTMEIPPLPELPEDEKKVRIKEDRRSAIQPLPKMKEAPKEKVLKKPPKPSIKQ